jgi:hypothetical protein
MLASFIDNMPKQWRRQLLPSATHFAAASDKGFYFSGWWWTGRSACHSTNWQYQAERSRDDQRTGLVHFFDALQAEKGNISCRDWSKASNSPRKPSFPPVSSRHPEVRVTRKESHQMPTLLPWTSVGIGDLDVFIPSPPCLVVYTSYFDDEPESTGIVHQQLLFMQPVPFDAALKWAQEHALTRDIERIHVKHARVKETPKPMARVKPVKKSAAKKKKPVPKQAAAKKLKRGTKKAS